MSDSADDEFQALVLDVGSGVTKAGFSGDDHPRVVFPTVVSTPKEATKAGPNAMLHYHKLVTKGDPSSTAVGDDAFKPSGAYKSEMRCPVQRGVAGVTRSSWDDIKKILHHTFYKELRVAPEEHSILLADAPFTPKVNRENMTTILFDTFNVPQMYLGDMCALSLYAAGRTTGCVVSSGAGVTFSVPVYEGYALPHAVRKMNLAGSDITAYLGRLLRLDRSFSNPRKQVIVRDIKERLCYVALETEKEALKFSRSAASSHEEKYELPDGQTLTIGDEMYRAPELLFDPARMGKEDVGIGRMTYDSIKASDIDVRKEMASNIILSGGSTMYPGMVDRMSQDITKLAPDRLKIKVIAPPERKYSVWIGGSILSSLSTFAQMWVTKAQYEETGPSIVHRMCS